MVSQSVAEELAALPPEQRAKALEALSEEECASLLYDWRGFLARPNQIAPEGDWDIWLMLAGRGFGKTKSGAEWVREQVDVGARRVALVAETAADARDVMIEGDSGLLSLYPPDQRPLYEPSKRRITWPSGAIGTLYNATEPNQLRGPQHDIAWCDEIAKWRYARQTWDQLQFGMRLGDNPRQVVTTTPRPIELIKAMLAGEEGSVVLTRGKTSDNRANLAAKFLNKIESRYANTRLGRQELNGEVLGDLPGALWRLDQIDLFRVNEIPELDRIVVAVDPAVTSTDESDANGIVVVGSLENHGYVLEDGSKKGTPMEWARKTISLYDEYDADAVVVEVNQGGDMVAHTLRGVRPNLKIVEVRASRGKHIRAEPISALYEQGRVHHMGSFKELEDEMVMMTASGYEGSNSPDRLDALVWGLTELFPSMTSVKSKVTGPLYPELGTVA